MKKVVKIIIIIVIFINFLLNVYAESVDTNFDSYVDELSKYSENSSINIDLKNLAGMLKNGNSDGINNVIEIALNILFKELRLAIASSVIILTIILISSSIRAIQIGKESSVITITNFLCYIALATVITTSFISMLELFKSTCLYSSSIMEVVSPFLLGMLIVNGGITTVSIIQPLLILVSNFLSFLICNVITPMIILSVIFAIIGNLNEKNTLVKIGSFLRKTSVWILGILLTVFLGILAMETSISKDVDSLTVKTTTAAVSNFVPVVGKFFESSMSSVIGASKVITKVGGTLGIIIVILTAIGPVIKFVATWISYTLISMFSEMIDSDKRVSTIILEISEIYKTMTGIIIANAILFIISIALMLNLSSSIV